jgi:hypothetical protein
MLRPAPMGIQEEVHFPIRLSAQLLYGHELDVGHYLYAASWDPSQGGMEIDPHVARVETEETTEALYPLDWPWVFLWPYQTEYGVPGNWHYGYWFFLTTFYAEGIGESLPLKPTMIDTGLPYYDPLWVPAYPPYNKVVGLAITGPFTLPPFPISGRVRVYAAGPYPYSVGWNYAPPDDAFKLLWEGRVPDDETWRIPFVDPPAAGAPTMPTVNTLGRRRVGLTVAFDEHDMPTDHVDRLLLYRSLASEESLPVPCDVGDLATLAVPLQTIELSSAEAWELGKRDGMMIFYSSGGGGALKDPSEYSPAKTQTFHFIDDIGPGIGDPPHLPWPQVDG